MDFSELPAHEVQRASRRTLSWHVVSELLKVACFPCGNIRIPIGRGNRALRPVPKCCHCARELEKSQDSEHPQPRGFCSVEAFQADSQLLRTTTPVRRQVNLFYEGLNVAVA